MVSPAGAAHGIGDHLSPRSPGSPSGAPDARGCEECLKSGMQWVHLRLCLTCGHVGCCDNSPGKHATKHARRTDHPVIQSYEPGEDWGWCYVEDARAGAVSARAPGMNAGRTAFTVLAAISFCHLLNDMMQALLPAMYPMLKQRLRAGLRPGRADHPHLPAHRVAAAAVIGLLHRPAGRSRTRSMAGMAFTLVGLVLCLSARRELSRAAASRPGWSGWAPRSSIPSRRGWRGWRRAGGTGWRSRSSRWAATRARRWGRSLAAFVVLPRGQRASPGSRWRRCSRSWCSGGWAAGTAGAGRRPARRSPRADPAPVPVGQVRAGAGRPDRAGLLQVHLPRQPDELLHLLSHPPVRGRRCRPRSSTSSWFLGAVAAGTIIGGPVGDRIGRKR